MGQILRLRAVDLVPDDRFTYRGRSRVVRDVVRRDGWGKAYAQIRTEDAVICVDVDREFDVTRPVPVRCLVHGGGCDGNVRRLHDFRQIDT